MALSNYRIIETVHQSRRFILSKAERLQDSKQVLIKTQAPAMLQDLKLSESLVKEASAAAQLSHPHIRKGLDCFSEGPNQYLVAEYAPGLPLIEYIRQNSDNVTYTQSLVWARDLLHALIYAAKRDVRHHNLNPYNIIINAASELKLIGFGKHRDAWQHSEGNFNYRYPILYVAPEIFKTNNPHPNSDIYSWAVLLYQILCKELPWRLDSFVGPDEQKLQSFSRAVTLPSAEKVPDGLYSVLLACLKLDPNERIRDFAELLDTLQQEVPDLDWSYHEPVEEVVPMGLPEPEPESSEADEEALGESELPIAGQIEPETKELSPELGFAEEPLPEPIVEDEAEAELQPEPDLPECPATESETEPEVTEFIQEFPAPIHEAPQEPEIQDDFAWPVIQDEPTRSIEADTIRKEPVMPPEPPEAKSEQVPKTKAAAAEVAPKQPAAPAPPPIEKPAASILPKPTYYDQDAELYPKAPKDLGSMKKIFITLMVLSLVFLSYVLIQRFFLRQKPKFDLKESTETTEIEDIDLAALAENIPLDLLWVPSDTLIMGSISPEAKDNEFPLLTIKISGFMISPLEITQEQWSMVYPSNPSLYIGANLPVENVSFYDVIEYCNAKSQKDGLKPAYDYHGSEIVCDFEADGYRLPTEAEWELAAKAGKGKNFQLYSGSDLPDEIGWYSENSQARSQTAGSKKPNSLGIYDMSGNVYEWVWNWYAPYSYRTEDLFSGPGGGTDKVIRGGSWYHNAERMRTTAREYVKPYVKTGYIGFRVVRSR
ncbi:MAG: SUMF1/EgtB/PvdO family nonheme iron enzyme [Candidatus Cloacimonetes bacterium]|jgi:formylglycine-generating enzyme required for sulfatase activity/serine/threonine protein kinase|nr:SUMF1/EgtB/PvdO family nonheme iron enzyme [Candidatus Cloacimonadota bacterium]MCB5287210.1 SUMF1/EgtB/PvdO family nonheme iron enzyme [Candidatus Cloacimonadota bacterium]MCK9185285.1 SUMF1/EgtB/PvdO family nonheme iron enzyme [Candidatus Cloacimonadota bacterium]MCK9583320.1 SUMF1/EgtB/PvdO family nonheme iron enzyme [Candidatus Cloacimonadota bacterium]MDY0229531.1 SUMF1/EgtB/PvdO family nonheme iron enzyme [Candidatus Cloacimonadaceae bacterium]